MHNVKRVMTYGDRNLLNYGRISFLCRNSELDERLVVAVFTDGFDWGQKRTNAYRCHIDTTVIDEDQKGKSDFLKGDCLGITYPLRISRTFTIQIACDYKK